MDDAQRRAIEWEVTRLIHHYVNCNDAQEWDAVAALYLPGGAMRRPSGGDWIRGREAILAAFRARPPRAQRHVVANVVVDVEAPDRARAFSVIVLYQGEPAGPGELPAMSANSPLVGWYRDVVERTANGWRFAQREGGLDFRP